MNRRSRQGNRHRCATDKGGDWLPYSGLPPTCEWSNATPYFCITLKIHSTDSTKMAKNNRGATLKMGYPPNPPKKIREE